MKLWCFIFHGNFQWSNETREFAYKLYQVGICQTCKRIYHRHVGWISNTSNQDKEDNKPSNKAVDSLGSSPQRRAITLE